MDTDPSALAAGLIFGLVGVAGWRFGRKRQSIAKMVISAALVIYPWMVSGPLALWGLGLALTLALFLLP